MFRYKSRCRILRKSLECGKSWNTSGNWWISFLKLLFFFFFRLTSHRSTHALSAQKKIGHHGANEQISASFYDCYWFQGFNLCHLLNLRSQSCFAHKHVLPKKAYRLMPLLYKWDSVDDIGVMEVFGLDGHCKCLWVYVHCRGTVMTSITQMHLSHFCFNNVKSFLMLENLLGHEWKSWTVWDGTW